MGDLQKLIDECIAAKSGNKEFALFWDGDSLWSAAIGNTSVHVSLGESDAEFYADGVTAEAAVAALLRELVA